MLVILLGIIDLIAGLILIFEGLTNFPTYILIILGIIVLIKSSLGMLKDFASWIDFLAGLILILSILINIPTILSVIIGLLILQKGVFSFL